jgi:hypothetical protein
VWHEKEPSLLKVMSAKHRSKFAALSLVMVTAAAKMKIAQAAINKQTYKTKIPLLNQIVLCEYSYIQSCICIPLFT